jgi:hypothetical protein
MQGQTSGVRVNEHLECGNGETVFRNACKLGLLSADEYNRFVRWARRGVWENLFRELAGGGRSTDTQMIDSTHVKAHRSAAGGKGGSRSRLLAVRAEGANTKIHALADVKGA